MGSGKYSMSSRSERAISEGYMHKSSAEIFKAREINNAMSPFGVKLRESRDSDEHPESLAIILGLDVTGSMGSVPHFLVKKGLPNIMQSIIDSGIHHPQLLFMGIGYHECDEAPLQIGQFESSDELLDKWLTDIYLEGRGGGNYGESYALAWYFAGHRTAIDCLEKRGQKGFLFTIGDEPVLKDYPAKSMKDLLGDKGFQYQDFSNLNLLEKAREKYHVYHIHIHETGAGSRQETIDEWIQLMGKDNLIIAEKKEDVSRLIVETITKGLGVETKIDDINQSISSGEKPSDAPTML